MNNLVFNTTASELKTSIYGQKPDTSLQLLQLDASDNLLVSLASSVTLTVAGTVTVSQITNPVTIGNASLTVAGSVTVAGTVTVSEITNPVTIGNASLTVAGSVTVAGTVTVSQITNPVTIGNASLTVAGTVTVSQITNPVTIGNASLTVLISGSTFTSSSVTSTSVTGTGVLFDDTNISAIKVASMLIYNEGAVPLTVSLQISPTTSDSDYMDDPDYTNVVILGNTNKFIAVGNFANYVRLQYLMGAFTGTFSVYYQAQA